MTALRTIPLACLFLLPLAAGAADFDRALYARLLDAHTRPVEDPARTRVDYAGLARSDDWKQLVAGLDRVDPERLASRAERLAFWINAYNVLALDVVVQHYPIESIKDAGSLFRTVWKLEAGRVGGRGISLDEIEHGILRPLGEPRIHGAIVCASVSCPALRREPWDPARIDAQLDDAMRTWLADREKGLAVEPAAGTLWLSRIFDWFDEDFEASGGVLAFVERHAPQREREWIERNAGTLRIRHLDYDWALNDLARSPSGG